MNNKFDELTKSVAQAVTRRAALKKFGVGLAGMALACFGLANRAEAGHYPKICQTDRDCGGRKICVNSGCYTPCNTFADCQVKGSTGTSCISSGRADYIGYCTDF